MQARIMNKVLAWTVSVYGRRVVAVRFADEDDEDNLIDEVNQNSEDKLDSGGR